MTLEEQYPLPKTFIDLDKQDYESHKKRFLKNGWTKSTSNDAYGNLFYRFFHFVNEKIHRDEGPAYIETWALNKDKYYSLIWYQNDEIHWLKGPAIYQLEETTQTYNNSYYINGRKITPNDYWTNPLVIKSKLNFILSDYEF